MTDGHPPSRQLIKEEPGDSDDSRPNSPPPTRKEHGDYLLSALSPDQRACRAALNNGASLPDTFQQSGSFLDVLHCGQHGGLKLQMPRYVSATPWSQHCNLSGKAVMEITVADWCRHNHNQPTIDHLALGLFTEAACFQSETEAALMNTILSLLRETPKHHPAETDEESLCYLASTAHNAPYPSTMHWPTKLAINMDALVDRLTAPLLAFRKEPPHLDWKRIYARPSRTVPTPAPPTFLPLPFPPFPFPPPPPLSPPPFSPPTISEGHWRHIAHKLIRKTRISACASPSPVSEPAPVDDRPRRRCRPSTKKRRAHYLYTSGVRHRQKDNPSALDTSPTEQEAPWPASWPTALHNVQPDALGSPTMGCPATACAYKNQNAETWQCKFMCTFCVRGCGDLNGHTASWHTCGRPVIDGKHPAPTPAAGKSRRATAARTPAASLTEKQTLLAQYETKCAHSLSWEAGHHFSKFNDQVRRAYDDIPAEVRPELEDDASQWGQIFVMLRARPFLH
jgi:hypothetical protein